jgi:hypothetical protein
MNRTTINLAIDVAAAALFLALLATGFVLGFALPPGTNKSLSLWGLSRHQFGNIHLGNSLAFLAIVLLHLSLHWSWVVSVAGKQVGLKISPKRSLLRGGLAVLLLLTAAISLFAWLAWAGVRPITDPARFDVCPTPDSPAGKCTDESPSSPVGSRAASRSAMDFRSGGGDL